MFIDVNYLRGARENYSPTYPQDCTIFFIQLNSVYNELKFNKMMAPYVKFSIPQDDTQGIPFPLNFSHVGYR